MKTSLRFISAAFLLVAALPYLPAADAPIVEIEIHASDNMKFDMTTFTVEPGASVHVTLVNKGTMPKEVMGHNWVLLQAGMESAKYASAAVGAKAENYEPKSLAPQVIASIPLLGARQSGEVTFTAPTQPGRYAFLCSFPAHCQSGMCGFMVVK